jgi:hypothetical protein
MNPISQLCPLSDSQAASLVRDDTMAALADDIVRSGAAPFARGALPAAHRARPAGTRRVRRRLLIGVPVAIALAVAGLIATSLGTPGQQLGPVNVGPPKAQAAALSFTRQHGYIRVIVRNPVADPQRYRAEFAENHLNITLTLVPASPSVVGTLVEESVSPGSGTQITPITATGRCYTGGGGNVCPVGVRVPVDFHGAATLVFGRAARPGEQYESAGQANGPGEAMYGLRYQGKTVAAVLAMLAKRGFTVPQYRVQRAGQCFMEVRRTVPGNWIVYDATPWAPGQVLLWAGKTPPVTACAGVRTSPSASPSPTGSAG